MLNLFSSLIWMTYLPLDYLMFMIRVIVLNTTFNNISVVVYIVVVSFIGGWNLEKNKDLPHVTDKLYHIILYWVHIALAGIELATLVMRDTDCICSYKSNCHTITNTTGTLSLSVKLDSLSCSLTFIYPFLLSVMLVVVNTYNISIILPR